MQTQSTRQGLCRVLKVHQDIKLRAENLALSTDEISRYSRHLLLPEIGREGQRLLKAARVLLVGTGGLGSPVAAYLAAAGVGTLGLVEFDCVDSTNLQRQILYRESDVGTPKIAAAAARLKSMASHINILSFPERLTKDNAMSILSQFDLVVDGSDNFATRYLVNDVAVALGIPNVHGSVYRFEGQASVFYPKAAPCYRCLFPAPPPPEAAPSCAEAGVLGVLPGQIGMVQATEALKLILGIGEPLLGRLLVLDALTMRWREFKLGRDPSCAACGDNARVQELTTAAPPAVSSCVAPSFAPDDVDAWQISIAKYLSLRVQHPAPLLLDVRGPAEIAICSIPGHLPIPLGELEERLGELPRDVPMIVYCKSGMRSLKAVSVLRRHGFARSFSLAGGILGLIAEENLDWPRY